MCKNGKFFHNKLLFILITFFFLSTNLSYGVPISKISKLSPYAKIFSPDYQIKQKAGFFMVVTAIAGHFLSFNGDKKSLKETLKDKDFFGIAHLLENTYLVISNESKDIEFNNGMVTIYFEDDDGNKGRIRICHKEREDLYQSPEEFQQMGNPEKSEVWSFTENYVISIDPDKRDTTADMKGQHAPSTNPVIKKRIKEKRVVEIYLDKENNTLKANKVKWIEKYVPGLSVALIPNELYYGREFNLEQIYTEKELNSLKQWMKTHYIEDSPVRFRIVLGGTALGWKDDVDHSNIAHAGARDRVIYIGSILLKTILDEENAALKENVLDNDELRHLLGFGHGSKKEHKKRLKLVQEVVKPIEVVKKAILENDVYYLYTKIVETLEADDKKQLLDIFYIANEVALSQPKYPIESKYPLRKAIAVLDKKENEKLIEVLLEKKSEEYIGRIIIDDILIMLDISKISENWLWVNAPDVDGRSIWIISPEIWNEGGGLARVKQYESIAIQKLTKGKSVRLKTLEPQYQYTSDASGKEKPLDYTKDITYPIDKLEDIYSCEVEVQGRKVKAVVSKGINSLGIDSFFIRDVQENGDSYFTRSLYAYRERERESDKLPSWEEFTEFFSKVSLAFTKEYEFREKKNVGENWKPSVLDINDSQLSLLPVYRRMMIEESKKVTMEYENHKVSPQVDHTLLNMIYYFNTHTYSNRRTYGVKGGGGEAVLEKMGIPSKYHGLFEHLVWNENKKCHEHIIDMASGALRTSDGQSGVSMAHVNDIFGWDEWVNDPTNPVANVLRKRFQFDVNITAISNGDNLLETAKVFRRIMKDEISQEAEPEYLEAEQVLRVKREAKKRLRLDGEGQEVYSSQKKVESGQFLDPNKPVISYSGRLVPEKAGRERVFTNENIIKLVKKGVQVVIYGNVQLGEDSKRIKRELVDLVDKLKYKKYPGNLIFVPKFSLEQQRSLLAATDIQVQDSDPKTEAAGYTESNVAACGGLQLAPYRSDNKFGEGLLQNQGTLIDIEKPGWGNTLVPVDASGEAYFDILSDVLGLDDGEEGYCYKPERLAQYQIFALRISRVVDVYMTAAENLRQYSYTIAKKKAKAKEQKISEGIEEMKKYKKELLNQLIPDQDESSLDYIVEKTVKLVVDDKAEEAVLLFFTSVEFQKLHENMYPIEKILNSLLEMCKRDQEKYEASEKFISLFGVNLPRLIGLGVFSDEQIKSLELILGQTKTIIAWMRNDLAEVTGNIRVTFNEENMVKSKKGKSFIDSITLPKEITAVQEEGGAGFFWRGTEGIKKLGINVFEELMYDKSRFEREKDLMMQYLMDHGFLSVPEFLLEKTKKGFLTTIHETFFINDLLPGSFQTTSTGAGHFQGMDLDIKQVAEGLGVQVNVKYSLNGEIEEVIMMEIKEGDIFFALPGYVDYVINLGGLRFNDMAKKKLTPEEAKEFSPGIDFSKINELEAAVEENAKYAPYIGMKVNARNIIVKAKEGSFKTIWRKMPSEEFLHQSWDEDKFSLAKFYKKWSRYQYDWTLKDFINHLLNDMYNKKQDITPNFEVKSLAEATEIAKEAIRENEDIAKDEPLGDVQHIKYFMEGNKGFIKEVLGEESTEAKLIRLPIEWIDNEGIETVKDFILELQDTHNGYIELYSVENIVEVNDDKYKPLIRTNKKLSKEFKPSRSNTITILPVYKNDRFDGGGNITSRGWDIGNISPEETIVSPVGFNYDVTGLARSVILGLRLSEIAGNNDYDSESVFVSYTFAQYMRFCLSQGQRPEEFSLTKEDLINMARGEISQMALALNRFIKFLPIIPLSIKEVRDVYEHVRKEVLIRA